MRLVADAGGVYAFCDTDSLFIVATEHGGLIACPGGTRCADDGGETVLALGWQQADAIISRFASLNPYRTITGSILKTEEENFDPDTGKQRQIECYAIASKRYGLFTRTSDGAPVLVTSGDKLKRSEHGLGHLLPPNAPSPDTSDRAWLDQWWQHLLRVELGHPSTKPAWFDEPAVGRLSIGSPRDLKPWTAYNATRPYQQQVKPGNFLTLAHPHPHERARPNGPRCLVAPFERDPRRRKTMDWTDRHRPNALGQRIRTEDPYELRTGSTAVLSYSDYFEHYRQHPETKATDPADRQACHTWTRGLLQPRHVLAEELRRVGKESNRLTDTGLPADEDGEQVIEYPAERTCRGCGALLAGRRHWCSEACRKRTVRAAQPSSALALSARQPEHFPDTGESASISDKHDAMRLTAVTTSGVGGLVDATVTLPEGPVAAFAGANGTGKSKLLAALLSPWTGVIPGIRTESVSEVAVEISLSDGERAALARLSTAMQWGEVDVAERMVVVSHYEPLVGVRQRAEPGLPVLASAFLQPQFLQAEKSLDLVYLPAERRLLEPGQGGIDLNQLSDLIASQKTAEPRAAVANYGRLDDQEFEQFAKALCVAAALPSEDDVASDDTEARVRWPEFAETVDALIAPKRLLPLTREHPEQLRIQTQDSRTHAVRDLSSGERQALVIVSRVMRAGRGNRVVLIDEPDAYLHPQLSHKLMRALERGVGEQGQLVVATHSPAILDSLAPSAIVRLEYNRPPRLVADEDERVELYRSAGFRESALTQSDTLLFTEGESDIALLTLIYSELSRAALRSAGGRAQVLRGVEQLAPYDLPVLGVVDGDVLAPSIPAAVEPLIAVWPTADIEGAFLADDGVLARMIDLGLIKPGFAAVPVLRSILGGLCDKQQDNVVAEIAQTMLRREAHLEWPSPRGVDPVGGLRTETAAMSTVAPEEVERAIGEAETHWSTHADNRWTVVRGKYVLNTFASQVSEMKSGQALLEAVARSQPQIERLATLAERLSKALG